MHGREEGLSLESRLSALSGQLLAKADMRKGRVAHHPEMTQNNR